jgi:hypothetical protein
VLCHVVQVKTITALSLAALAEAASPYGIESFDDVLEPLWRGIRWVCGVCGWWQQWGGGGRDCKQSAYQPCKHPASVARRAV